MIRNHIHGHASIQNLVVQPRLGKHLLTQHVDSHKENLHCMKGTAPLPWGNSGMSSGPVPLDPEINGGSGVEIPDRVYHRGMVMQTDVDTRERTCRSHVILTIKHFLGRAPKDLDRAWNL